ncbi:hypothetical protein [Brevibacillus fulvus]|uniref:Uncharacterized protein n=1 Tax=Brevibacillus fulvus TaxID=1125967 RepID=A0A938Y480_9BACL|nr:hypothetical protein [Brevibacillus fulvus]MBM7592019.1 hypothetical protein [Brevibacillus fulvus]
MEAKLARYYQLKQLQKATESEIEQLRQQILAECREDQVIEAGEYKLTIHNQHRREYDDQKLYDALPDAALWRLLSKADAAKINSMLKLKVISDELLQGTFHVKQVPVIRVEKQ